MFLPRVFFELNLACGDSSSGYELFLNNGYLPIVYVYTQDSIYRFKSDQKIPQGEPKLRIAINKTGGGAIANLSIGDRSLGFLELPKLWPIYTPNSGLGYGQNRHAPIGSAYQAQSIFDQTLKRVIVDVDVSRLMILTDQCSTLS